MHNLTTDPLIKDRKYQVDRPTQLSRIRIRPTMAKNNQKHAKAYKTCQEWPKTKAGKQSNFPPFLILIISFNIFFQF